MLENISKDLKTIKSDLLSIQQMICKLEEKIKNIDVKIINNLENKKIKKKNNNPSGFAKPQKISDELCKFMCLEPKSYIARTEVTKFINKYIKENNLQDSKNRQRIILDEDLKKLLKTNEVTYFTLQRYMNRHYEKE
tara:strand:- start:214 stop:624 length:411 start_codon:yes stop_codon:yes gene_type:complete